MTRKMTRRQFLVGTSAAGALLSLPSIMLHPTSTRADSNALTTLRVGTREIEVNGRTAKVFGLRQPDGTHGLVAEAGQRFRVRLENHLDESTLVHWHGLTPPPEQDGVPDLSEPPVDPGDASEYDFVLDRPGTNWMHSHLGLQEQRLLAAPLIVRAPNEADDDAREVVVMLHDFTFRDPDDILADLQEHGHGDHNGHDNGHGDHNDHGDHNGHGNGHGDHGDHGNGNGHGDGAVHLHDVEYDAFLANDRTLTDPEVHRVAPGGRVRLRLINAATATAFHIDLGHLEGELIAVDGRNIEPVHGHRFPMAIAQRLDILLDLPDGDGSWPVFAVREGRRDRTGIVLATPDGAVPQLSDKARDAVPPVGLELEERIHAASPLEAREPDREHVLHFSEADGYTWKMNGAVFEEHEPLAVREGERVEITFRDDTTMAHPMHLHGHHFQVVGINGERVNGAMRDTVLVPAGGEVTIAFDADNPGEWALHCHHLYHMAGGMMTTVKYE